MEQVDVSATRDVEGMSARTEQSPLLARQRHAAIADGADEHASSVANGRRRSLEYEAIGKREAIKLGIPDSATISWTCCARGAGIMRSFQLRPELFDPDDEFVLELAFVARCDFIVTHNIRDLQPG